MAVRDLDPPPELPDLQAEVTHVWLLSETYGEDRYVVWQAGENRPWRRLVLAWVPEEERLVVAEGDQFATPASEVREGEANPAA